MCVKRLLSIYIFSFLLQQSSSSFWNEIPPNCIYDRKTIFSCWNTTFTQPIPLFNDLAYTMQNHQIFIRNSYFQLAVRDLLIHVGTNIENLTLINNTFSSSAIELSRVFEGGIFFRLLSTLSVHDSAGLQWLQFNGSYFPQLINLDLSRNQLTNKNPLVFDHQYYPKLKSLDLSFNQLDSLENLLGNGLKTLETLILSHNPLEKLDEQHFQQFPSLQTLDLSFTSLKHLFPITILPNLQTFRCEQCRQISSWEYEKFFANCSDLLSHSKLTIDLTHSNIYSMKLFNPYIQCFKTIILNEQNLVDSINTNDLLNSISLEHIQARKNDDLEYVFLNIYDHLLTIDFSENIYLNQIILRLMSNYTHLQHLNLSYTGLTDFSIDFYNTTLKYLHIDAIDMSHSHLETIDFLKYLTFHRIDLSFNRLKIVDINLITYRHGMYDLALMNLLNLSSNQMEYLKVSYENESPHTIDLSNSQLETIDLAGQTTYTLLLNRNPKLTLQKTKFRLQIPSLQYLDLSSVNFYSLEYLVHLHNLSKLHTIILNHNRLGQNHRTLNWHLFEPWKNSLTHLSLQNLSLEQIDPGVRLNDFYHLLTIDFYYNNHLQCNCRFRPFIEWLKSPPPPLKDIYEPLQKFLRIDCPISLFDLNCDEEDLSQQTQPLSSFWKFLFSFVLVLCLLLIIFKLIDRKMNSLRSRFYQRVYTDGDVITLNERHITFKTDDD